MFIKRKFDKFVIALVLAAIFLYASIRPSFHLRSDMPAGFVVPSNPAEHYDPSRDEKVAKAYWECVVTQIQRKYGYGYHLPDSAPPEFEITPRGLRSASSADRDRYWRNLQQVWYDPNSWVTEYEWNLGWAKNPLRSTADWLQKTL